MITLPSTVKEILPMLIELKIYQGGSPRYSQMSHLTNKYYFERKTGGSEADKEIHKLSQKKGSVMLGANQGM